MPVGSVNLIRSEGDKRTFSTHCDCIRDTNRVVLPCQHALFLYSILDSSAQVQHLFRNVRSSVLLFRLGKQGSPNPSSWYHSQCILPSKIRVVYEEDKVSNVLAWITLPPHGCYAHMWTVLHCMPVWHSRSVQHRLPVAVSNNQRHVGYHIRLTCAPGKSCSLVMVEEYLLRIGFPSRVASSGRWGKSRKRGSSA